MHEKNRVHRDEGVLPTVMSATRRLVEAFSTRYLSAGGVPEREFQRIARRIEQLLGSTDEALTTAALRERLGAGQSLSRVVNLMCDQGRLIRDKPVGSWKSRNFTYRRFADDFPDIPAVAESDAVRCLVESYVRPALSAPRWPRTEPHPLLWCGCPRHLWPGISTDGRGRRRRLGRVGRGRRLRRRGGTTARRCTDGHPRHPRGPGLPGRRPPRCTDDRGARSNPRQRNRAHLHRRSVEGEAHEALIEASGRAIAVVARGHGSVRGLRLGSTSQAVIRHAHCPVFVIHLPSPAESAATGGLNAAPPVHEPSSVEAGKALQRTVLV